MRRPVEQPAHAGRHWAPLASAGLRAWESGEGVVLALLKHADVALSRAMKARVVRKSERVSSAATSAKVRAGPGSCAAPSASMAAG